MAADEIRKRDIKFEIVRLNFDKGFCMETKSIGEIVSEKFLKNGNFKQQS